MDINELPDRYYASIPADDPRFAELRIVLASVRQAGRASPAARMLGEWALLGFLLTSGRLPLSGLNEALIATAPTAQLLADQAQIAQAARGIGGFDE